MAMPIAGKASMPNGLNTTKGETFRSIKRSTAEAGANLVTDELEG